MRRWRHLFAERPAVVVILLVAALVMRLVPAGFMIAPSASTLWIDVTVCSGLGVDRVAVAVPVGKDAPRSSSPEATDAASCPFASASLPVLPTVDPDLLVAALLFAAIVALLAPAPLVVGQRPRWRPPSHAPPTAF